MHNETPFNLEAHCKEEQAANTHLQRSLLKYLKEVVLNLPEEELHQSYLEEMAPSRYNQLQEAQSTLDGSSHTMTVIETIFEYHNNVTPLPKTKVLEAIEGIQGRI